MCPNLYGHHKCICPTYASAFNKITPHSPPRPPCPSAYVRVDICKAGGLFGAIRRRVHIDLVYRVTRIVYSIFQ